LPKCIKRTLIVYSNCKCRIDGARRHDLRAMHGAAALRSGALLAGENGKIHHFIAGRARAAPV